MAVLFDASGDALTRTANQPALNNFTCGAWVKPISAMGSFGIVFDFSWSGGITLLYLDSSFHLNFYNGSSTDLATLSAGTRYYLALIGDGSGVKVYWRPEGTGSFSSSSAILPASNGATGANPFRLGNDDFGDFGHEEISYYRLWDATLTPTELLAESASSSVIVSSGLSMDTPLVDAATAATDNSGNSRNWTVGGTLTDATSPTLPDFGGSGGTADGAAAATSTVSAAGSSTARSAGASAVSGRR